jgi:hypothetical protein
MRVSLTRDDAPRRLAFESVADEGDDLNLLASLEFNADHDATNSSNANHLLEPAPAVHAEAIDLALDSVFARRSFRALRAAW